MPLSLSDGLVSLSTSLGVPTRSPVAGASYGYVHYNDTTLENAYTSSWMVRQAVDIPVQDAVRKWRAWSGEGAEKVAALETELGVRGKVRAASIAARVYGEAYLMLGTSVADPALPLGIDREELSYLPVFSRREVVQGELVRDPGDPLYGEPEHYDLQGDGASVRVHPSRLVRFQGRPPVDPWRARSARRLGRSVVADIYDTIRRADATISEVADLVANSNTDVLSIEGLFDMVADPELEAKLLKRVGLAAALKTTRNITLLDEKEKYQRVVSNLAQTPDLVQVMLQLVAGAADIPLTRMMGTSAKGLGNTGEGELANYHESVQAMQELDMGPAMATLDRLLVRTALGRADDAVTYAWTPLRQMTEKEQAEIGKSLSETALRLRDAGTHTAPELREAITPTLDRTGLFAGLAAAVADTDAAGGFDLGGDGDDADDILPAEGDDGGE